jgi:hypothetical protein
VYPCGRGGGGGVGINLEQPITRVQVQHSFAQRDKTSVHFKQLKLKLNWKSMVECLQT